MSLANDEQVALAPTPPMGWNSWDCYGSAVTEQQVKATADYMAEHLAGLGWEYVVVDIQWHQPEPSASFYPESDDHVLDQYGRFLPAPDRFPSSGDGKGFKLLADYVHGKGLKFGIHIVRGVPRLAVKRNTPILGADLRAADITDRERSPVWCENTWGIDMSRPGAQEYYDSIVQLYAAWDVDYIKADDMCNPRDADEVAGLSEAIKKCGRPIVLSLSGVTPLEHAEFVAGHAQLWRISNDLWDIWEKRDEGQEWTATLKGQFALCAAWAPHIGPGHWPDPDMLTLGRISMQGQHGPDRQTRLTKDEQFTMMTLWSISRAPLMFGGDLLSMDPFTLSLIANGEVLAVNQNSANNRELYRRGDQIVWVADVPDAKGKYVAAFNVGDAGATAVEVSFEELGLSGRCTVRDVWEKKDLGVFEDRFSPTINPHGASLYKLEE